MQQNHIAFYFKKKSNHKKCTDTSIEINMHQKPKASAADRDRTMWLSSIM